MTDAEKFSYIGSAVHALAVAAVKDDWGAMQAARQEIMRLYDTPHTALEAVKLVMNGYSTTVIGERHCLNCHEVQSRHADGDKCLFGPTTFCPCVHVMPLVVIQNLKAKMKINAIKEYRLWTNVSLREAKDIIEAEAARHGW